LEKINNPKPDKKPLKSFSLSKIGNLIKEARLQSNQSISELAEELKISAQQFKAIEDGQEELLPEKVFIKAMVKRISEKLKLDTEFIMSEFNNKVDEINVDRIAEAGNKEKKINAQSDKESSFIFIVAIFISGLIGLLASSAVLNTFSNLDNRELKNEVINRN